MSPNTWAKKLFAPKAGRTARRPAARTRLGLEQFGDRLMPSATAGLVGRTLDIHSDVSGGDVVVSWVLPNSSVQVKAGTQQIKVANTFDFDRITYTGSSNSSAHYKFSNQTNIAGEYHSGAGEGDIFGGSGANTFYAAAGRGDMMHGGSGPNTFLDAHSGQSGFIVGTGSNLLYRASGAVLQDEVGVAHGSVSNVGLSDNPYSYPAGLTDTTKTGLTVFLNGPGTILTVEGPTGGGFQIDGHWTETRTRFGDGTSTHSFTASGPVQLETGLLVDRGDGRHRLTLPLPAGGLTVTTAANPFNAPVGQYAGMTLQGGLKLTNDAAGESSAFTKLMAAANLGATTGDFSWGIKLGSDPTLTALNMPLLADVPYLYLTAQTGVSASFGDHASAGVGPQAGVALVFDPADPAVFVQATCNVGTFTGGVSLHSVIPYTPSRMPTGASNPAIWGTLYASGAGIALGELPVAVSGNLTLSLDAQHDGRLLNALGQSPNTLRNLLSGQAAGMTGLQTLAGAAGRDLGFGLNGGVALTGKQYGISFSADVASGSLWYTPNANGSRTVAFDVGTVNPFAGTPLEQFAPSTKVDVGGWLTTGTSGTGVAGWGFRASTAAATVGGFAGSSLLIEAGSATNTAHAHMNVNGLMGAANFDVDGTVDLRNGDFDLRQTATLDIDAKIASLHVDESFHFGYHGGTFVADAHLHGSLILGTADWNFHAYVDGDVSLSVDHGKVKVAGHGDIGAGFTFWGVDYCNVSLGFDFDDQGFGVSVLGREVKAKW